MKKPLLFIMSSVLTLALAMPAIAQDGAAKKIRVALCGIQEEVNTFATETMGFAKVTDDMATGFQKFEGEGLIEEFKGTATWPGGWVDAFLESPQVEFIPVALYNYSAGPTIQGEAYQKMKKDVLDSLKAAMPLDGVAIQMHGAGVAEGVTSIEEDLTTAIRQLVGPNVKLASALDHHANMTDGSFKPMDFITIVKEEMLSFRETILESMVLLKVSSSFEEFFIASVNSPILVANPSSSLFKSERLS